MNPILIRELRQFTRNNYVTVLLLIYVGLMLFIAGVCTICAILSQTDKSVYDDSIWLVIDAIGREPSVCMFGLLSLVVYLVSIFAIVIPSAWSFSQCRVNEDMMFYSSLKPSTIVFGKFLSGIVCSMMLFSITLPFVMLAYMLRGVDIVIIGIVFSQIFLVVQILNLSAILSASTSKNRFIPYQVVISILVLVVLTFPLVNMAGEEWSMMSQEDMLKEVGALLFIEVSLIALLLSGAIAMLSPQSSNKFMPLRILLMLVLLAGFIVSLTGVFLSPWYAGLIKMEELCAVTLSIMIFMVVCESDQWSPRIRRSLPKSLLLRVVIFPFYTGSACGLVWIMLLSMMIVVFDLAVLFPVDGKSLITLAIEGHCSLPFVLLGFSFNYNVTAMLLLKRSADKSRVKNATSPDRSQPNDPKIGQYIVKDKIHYIPRVWLVTIFLLVFVMFISIMLFSAVCDLGPAFDYWNQYNESLISMFCPACDFSLDLPQSAVQIGGVEIEYIASPIRVTGMLAWFIVLLPILFFWYLPKLKMFSPIENEDVNVHK
ncbi:MAG: hypothetical protein LBQ66_08465 [Planctomycetaceae bacterium]|jgi:hypothetical protein|nr:hypothetical protein [Planctomycetaceae bacterium]